MDNELISVIIPVYNVSKYLEQCVKSVQDQSYENIEIILVDDGSNDGSEELCEKFAAMDRRVNVIHQKNSGLSAARNAGIHASKGTYIAFIDSDDFIHPRYIHFLYETMRNTDSDLVCTESLNFIDGQDGEVLSYWHRHVSEIVGYEVYEPLMLLEKVFYQWISITAAQLKLYKRALFEGILFPEGKYYEDLATTYSYILASTRIAVVDAKLYAYRIREGSILNGYFSPKMLDCLWVSEQIRTDVAVKYTELSRAVYCAIFRINRIVFAQMKTASETDRNCVWEEIVRNRKSVAVDKEAQKYERLLAITSYSGKRFFMFFLQVFKLFRKNKIIWEVRR